MNRPIVTWLVALALASCRNYEYEAKVTDQDGLVPPDQFARYGAEQAQAVAIAREYGRAEQGRNSAALARQADAAMAYARTLPGVADIDADPLGHHLTIRFKSGWRVAVTPIQDGKSGPETAGLKPAPGGGKP